MKTLTLFNHKGGVGKTTLTANLSDALADLGFCVLMIDADPQCNLTSFFLEGSSHKCVHDSAPAGRPRRGKRVRMRSCQLTSGEVVCRSVDGRLRGPRF